MSSSETSVPARGPEVERLRRELLRLGELPAPPRILQEIWQVLGSEDGSAKGLAEVVEKDPGLTVRTLRLANSAYFALKTPVTEVRIACVVLGFDTIQSLAVGATALDVLTRRVGNDFDLDAFWRHSVGVGAASRMLARQAGRPPGSAFCAGLLHDIGKLVLATLAPERYRAACEHAGERPLRECEIEEYGADHAETGAWLGTRWRFPRTLVKAIRDHHGASNLGPGAAIIAVADWVARCGGCPSIPDVGEAVPESPAPGALATLGLREADLAPLSELFATERTHMEAFVDLARK